MYTCVGHSVKRRTSDLYVTGSRIAQINLIYFRGY